MGFEFIKRYVVCHNQHFLAEIDEYRDGDQQFLLFHIVFSNFSPAALKSADEEWSRFRSVVKAPIFAMRSTGTEKKFARFCARFGFKPTNFHLPTNNGVIRKLYISTVHPHGQQFFDN